MRLFSIRVFLVGLLTAATLAVTPAVAPAQQLPGCAISGPDEAYSGIVEESDQHAQIWRLYQAFFLRQPDENGIKYWVGKARSGRKLENIAYQFAQSPEFINRYGVITDDEFIELIYRNVQCRPAEGDGADYWRGVLSRGSSGRHQVILYFSEGAEYLNSTGTCLSLFADQDAKADDCDPPVDDALVPLAQASLESDGYEAVSYTIDGATFRGTAVDLSRNLISTGSDRCSVSSINGNWLTPATKDSSNPAVIGLGIVDGRPVNGSGDLPDFGIFGMRYESSPDTVVEVWPGNTPSDADKHLNSVLYADGTRSIEMWHGAAKLSPYLLELAPESIVDATEWEWAAAGIHIRLDGQTDPDFGANYARDPYTFQTTVHPFVAVDQDAQRLIYGAVSGADVRDIANWAAANGYEDLMKFDGGGSVEYNVNRSAVVDSTPRKIPVWIGVGC